MSQYRQGHQGWNNRKSHLLFIENNKTNPSSFQSKLLQPYKDPAEGFFADLREKALTIIQKGQTNRYTRDPSWTNFTKHSSKTHNRI